MQKNFVGEKNMKDIKKIISNKNLSYQLPWFYNNKLALRCELGQGDEQEEFIMSAEKRALKIFDVLFDGNVDLVFFDHEIFDYSRDWGDGDFLSLASMDFTYEKNISKLMHEFQDFPHQTIENIKFDPRFTEDGVIKINRCIAEISGKQVDYKKYVKSIINAKLFPIHFVSYKNQCIYSIYDSRGLDIVFFSKEKYREFFVKLNEFLFEYDLPQMQKTFDKK